MSRTPYLDHPGPIPLAHRGFSPVGLENSMAAFAAAVELGYRYVETDVHATSDGVAVAFHDHLLDRVTDRRGEVARLPWREVSRARIGNVEPVPRLEEVLATWPELRLNIDIKSPGAVLPLVRAVERARAHERVCVTSFHDGRRRAALLRLSRPVATSASRRGVTGFVAALRVPVPGRAAAVRAALRGLDLLQVPERAAGLTIVTPASVAAARAAGVGVHVWTVDEPAHMHRLLDLGVDGLVTDRADLLKEVLTGRGAWH